MSSFLPTLAREGTSTPPPLPPKGVGKVRKCGNVKSPYVFPTSPHLTQTLKPKVWKSPVHLPGRIPLFLCCLQHRKRRVLCPWK